MVLLMASQSTAGIPGAIGPVKAARIPWGAVRMARLLDQFGNFQHFVQPRTLARDKKRPGRPDRHGTVILQCIRSGHLHQRSIYWTI